MAAAHANACSSTRTMISLSNFLSAMLVCGMSALPARAQERPAEPYAAYLFAHFMGESPLGEQIYFAVSRDGLNWKDLNDSAPVLHFGLGEKGVRDPSIIRSADGAKFYILATDLRIASAKGWDAARFQGSTSLVFWESSDLVNWSAPWMVDVAGAIPGAGCAWAPEAVYDETTKDYIVYWATISPRDGVREARIFYAKTKDFRTFSPAQLYIERVGEGVNAQDIIDTQIIEVKGGKYRYYRASRDSQITIEGANAILGSWNRLGDISSLGYTAREVEGPILFQFNQEAKWGMLVDQYAAGKGYLPLVSTDLSVPDRFRVLAPQEYSLGESRKRHGPLLNLTQAEYNAVVAKWPSVRAVKLGSYEAAERLVRHAAFKITLAANVQPAEDAQWRIVPGLAGGEGAVSLRAVNFPGYYLTQQPPELTLAPNDGDAAFAARATFQKMPGLADPSGVSFRILGDDSRYLLERESALTPGSVATDADRRRATFRIVE
jgi:hypothetical protein